MNSKQSKDLRRYIRAVFTAPNFMKKDYKKQALQDRAKETIIKKYSKMKATWTRQSDE